MTNQPQAPHLQRTPHFLERLRRWVEPRPDVRALVVVGSVARGNAQSDSDIDVVLLTTDIVVLLDRDGHASALASTSSPPGMTPR